MPDKRKVFHVNMLKIWYPPVATNFRSAEDMEMDEEEFDPCGNIRVVILQSLMTSCQSSRIGSYLICWQGVGQ